MSNASPPTLKLTGWKAVLVIAAVLAFGAYRAVSARRTLDTQGRAAVEEAIANRVRARMLRGPTPTTEAEVRALLDAGEVRVRSMDAHGSRDDLVVRVEIEPIPAFPAETDLVQYHRLEHGQVMAWRVRSETTRLAYGLALL